MTMPQATYDDLTLLAEHNDRSRTAQVRFLIREAAAKLRHEQTVDDAEGGAVA